MVKNNIFLLFHYSYLTFLSRWITFKHYISFKCFVYDCIKKKIVKIAFG